MSIPVILPCKNLGQFKLNDWFGFEWKTKTAQSKLQANWFPIFLELKLNQNDQIDDRQYKYVVMYFAFSYTNNFYTHSHINKNEKKQGKES